MSAETSRLTKPKWGARRRSRDPSAVMREASIAYDDLRLSRELLLPTLQSVKDHFLKPSRSYYSLAALSRRSQLDNHLRAEAKMLLFPLRALLEARIIAALQRLDSPLDVVLKAGCKSFFGKSIKQGISIRYPLSTCVPTQLCAGACYAHDGRDRDYLKVFRGALNGLVGIHYEKHPHDRPIIIRRLSKQIDEIIKLSREEALRAKRDGYGRSPRIRFSHVGEMAATPIFSNALASEIKSRAPDVSCVVYTRHPEAAKLDTQLFVVNYTVDGISDARIRFLPINARLVSSSWNGEVHPEAAVNFLEHHVEKMSKPLGRGSLCPVTENHKKTPTCDSARCDICFVQPPINTADNEESP